MKKFLIISAKLLITSLLLGYVAYKAGLTTEQGWQKLFDVIRQVNIFYLVLSFAIGVCLNTVSAWKWHVLQQRDVVNPSFLQLLSLYYIGKFFNIVLPTSLGGDVMRVYQLGKETANKSYALASVFVERFTGMITLVLLVVLVLTISLKQYSLFIVFASLAFCAVLILLLFWFIWNDNYFGIVEKYTARFHKYSKRILDGLRKAHSAVNRYKSRPRTLVFAFALSLLFYALAIVNVWVSASAFSAEVDFVKIALAVPVMMMIMNLPVSIGGIGLMEAAYTFIFSLLGYSPILALSTALLMRFKSFFDAGVGGMIYMYKQTKTA